MRMETFATNKLELEKLNSNKFFHNAKHNEFCNPRSKHIIRQILLS